MTAERANNGIFVMLLQQNKKLTIKCRDCCIVLWDCIYLEVSISLLVSGQPCTIVMVSFCGSMGVSARIYTITFQYMTKHDIVPNLYIVYKQVESGG